MCLIQLSSNDEQMELAKLPATFPCWKAMHNNKGRTEFAVDSDNEPRLVRRHIYVAALHQGTRSLLNYTASFHAFLHAADAKMYAAKWCLVVVKFWANNTDIVRIGENPCGGQMCIAVSKITRK